MWIVRASFVWLWGLKGFLAKNYILIIDFHCTNTNYSYTKIPVFFYYKWKNHTFVKDPYEFLCILCKHNKQKSIRSIDIARNQFYSYTFWHKLHFQIDAIISCNKYEEPSKKDFVYLFDFYSWFHDVKDFAITIHRHGHITAQGWYNSLECVMLFLMIWRM